MITGNCKLLLQLYNIEDNGDPLHRKNELQQKSKIYLNNFLSIFSLI